MKALFVYECPAIFVPTSPERALMREYANAIGELHVVSSSATGQEETDGNLRLHGVRTSRLMRPWALAKRARGLIEKYRIEAVSAQDPFEQGYAALRALRGTPAKLHVQVPTDFLSPWYVRNGIYRSPRVNMPFLNRIHRMLAARVLPAADAIRTTSQRAKDSLVATYGERIPEPVVIPVTVPMNVPPKVPLPPAPFTFALITVSGLEPEKRIEDVLAAINRLKDQYPSLGVFIVGEGRERKRLESMAHRLGIGSRVVFLGARDDAWGLMQSAQAFIEASAYEGDGKSLIEAALAKVPIIVTDVGLVGEVFKGYDHVLAAPVGDPTNLAAHIAWLIEDLHARRELALNAEVAARAYLLAAGAIPERLAASLRSIVGTPHNTSQEGVH